MRPTNSPPPLFAAQMRSFASLEKAWRHVRGNAIRSTSQETRSELSEFEQNVTSRLRSIQARLAKGTFIFGKSKGVTVGPKQRPIVIAPIESRIVQRAILEVVQGIPSVRDVLHSGFNFGGIDGPEFGVRAAVAKALRHAQSGGYYVRTDIRSFFVHVPRARAAALLTEHFKADPAFTRLFNAAIETELRDTERLDGVLHLFPLADEGVAQGSCLSPLLCNYLLHSFDEEMNSRGLTCIRYIDDFILFGKDRRTVLAGLKKALQLLGDLGLSAYDPNKPEDVAKASQGRADHGFEFLGCEIWPGRVRPSSEKQAELIDSVASIYDRCLRSARQPQKAIHSPAQVLTFAGAVLHTSQVVRGWGNSYAFCSDDRLMASLDAQLEKVFREFRRKYGELTANESASSRRRTLGLFSLSDCNRDESDTSARSLALAWRSSSHTVNAAADTRRREASAGTVLEIHAPLRER